MSCHKTRLEVFVHNLKAVNRCIWKLGRARYEVKEGLAQVCRFLLPQLSGALVSVP